MRYIHFSCFSLLILLMSDYRQENRRCAKLRRKWAYPPFRRAVMSLTGAIVGTLLLFVVVVSGMWLMFHTLYLRDAHATRELSHLLHKNAAWYAEACQPIDSYKAMKWQATCMGEQNNASLRSTQALSELGDKVNTLASQQMKHELRWVTERMPDHTAELIFVLLDVVVVQLLHNRNVVFPVTLGVIALIGLWLFWRWMPAHHWDVVQDIWSCRERSISDPNVPNLTEEFESFDARHRQASTHGGPVETATGRVTTPSSPLPSPSTVLPRTDTTSHPLTISPPVFSSSYSAHRRRFTSSSSS